MLEIFLKRLKAKGWTQEQIAKKAGLSQALISKLSNGGKCELDTAIKLADAFSLTLDEVVGRTLPEEEDPPPKPRRAAVKSNSYGHV